MRFVPVKTEEQQAVLMMHRARDFLVRQLTQVTNAIRAHLSEFGIVAPKGVHNIERLLAIAEGAVLPERARNPIRLLAEQFRDTQTKIEMSQPRSGRLPTATRLRVACRPCPASARSRRVFWRPRYRTCRTSRLAATWRRRAERAPSA